MGDLISTWLRLSIGFVVFAFTTTVCMLVCALLLPFRTLRIKTCNYYGKFTGRFVMRISGCPLTIEGEEHLDASRPAIYVSNHTTLMDAFMAMFLSPVGTVGVVKKQILYYPFFGQMYLLSGHLRIDRSNREAAVKSMAELGEFVVANKLSIYVWPEGTRSRDGRLLPFKKGVYHMAKQTGLPIVPIVIEGAHRAWVKNSMSIARVPIKITILPAIDTSDWDGEHIEEQLATVRQRYLDVLPEEQHPKTAAAA